jgi:hypothetical protein
MDKMFLCETCSQLTPWPCPMEHDCSMPCPQCNPEGDPPGDFESTERGAGLEGY